VYHYIKKNEKGGLDFQLISLSIFQLISCLNGSLSYVQFLKEFDENLYKH
jgi:hypothetical protein